MKKITSLFVYNKVVDGKIKGQMVCINNDTFISAKWLSKEVNLPIPFLRFLVGSSIAVTYFAKGENMVTQVDAEPKLCTDSNKIVKEFAVMPSASLMTALLETYTETVAEPKQAVAEDDAELAEVA